MASGLVPKNNNPGFTWGIFPREFQPLHDARVEQDEFSVFLKGREDLALAQFQAGYPVSAREFVEGSLVDAVRSDLLAPDVSVADPRVRQIVHAGFGTIEDVIEKLAGQSKDELLERYGEAVLILLLCYLDPQEAPTISNFWDIRAQLAAE